MAHARSRTLLASAALAMALTAGAASAQQAAPAEVIHWMTARGEAAALKVMVDQFTSEGGKWVDSAISPGATARSTAATRVVSGNPPTAMMFVTKLQLGDLLDNGLMADVAAVAKADKWSDVLPAPVLSAVTQGNQVFAVPLDLQVINVFWYNKSVYAKAGVTPPTKWAEVIPAFEKLKAAGVLPLAMQSEDVNYRNLFASVLLGLGGPELYDRIFKNRDAQAARSPAFRQVAENFKKIKDFTDPAAATRTWNDAARMMIRGEAGTQVLGSWVKGEVTAAGLKPGEDIGCALMGDFAAINTSLIAFPKKGGAADAAAQSHLARLFMNPKLQAQFSQLKGSLPPRNDVDTSSFDVCARSWVQAIRQDGHVVFDSQVIIDPAPLGAMVETIISFWSGKLDTDQFIDRFARNLTAKI